MTAEDRGLAVHDALVLRSEWRNMVLGGDWGTHWAWHPALGRWRGRGGVERGSLERNGRVVTIELICDDDYEAMALYDKISVGLSQGKFTITVDVNSVREESGLHS